MKQTTEDDVYYESNDMKFKPRQNWKHFRNTFRGGKTLIKAKRMISSKHRLLIFSRKRESKLQSEKNMWRLASEVVLVNSQFLKLELWWVHWCLLCFLKCTLYKILYISLFIWNILYIYFLRCLRTITRSSECLGNSLNARQGNHGSHKNIVAPPSTLSRWGALGAVYGTILTPGQWLSWRSELLRVQLYGSECLALNLGSSLGSCLNFLIYVRYEDKNNNCLIMFWWGFN